MGGIGRDGEVRSKRIYVYIWSPGLFNLYAEVYYAKYQAG